MPTANAPRELVEPEGLALVARELASHWGDASLEFVRNFDNLVYRIAGASPLYLRISRGTRRSREQIDSELAVVQHAADSGALVARPVPSRSGDLTHALHTGDVELIASVFREAEGIPYEAWSDRDSPEFFVSVGEHMGKLHRSLSAFARPEGFRRFRWNEDRWAHFGDHVPSTEMSAWRLFSELDGWTQTLSLREPDFGLIHGDFTIVNFRMGRAGPCLFDFDCCCEHWRAYELAMFLHYFSLRDPETRRKIRDNTLEGYARARSLPADVLEQLPRFAELRLLYSFLVFAEEWGFENLTPQQEAYFEQRRRAFSEDSAWSERALSSHRG